MEFQGKEIHIPIKGIDRSGPDGLSAEGAMTEVIGMEYFDGSYVPYKPVGSDSLLPANLLVSCVRVHKTSKQENTIIVCHDQWRHGELDNKSYATTCYVKWKPSDNRFSDSWVNIMSTSWTENISIDFIGNVLCVRLGDNSIRYFFFNGTGYEERNVDGTKPYVMLRVTRGLYDKDAPANTEYWGRKSHTCVKLSTFGTTGQFYDAYQSVIRPAITNKKTATGLLTKAMGLQTERGGLTGYVLACVAYRLKNGQYVMASAPILLCPPNIRHTEKGTQTEKVYGYVAKSGSESPGAIAKSSDYQQGDIVYGDGDNDSGIVNNKPISWDAEEIGVLPLVWAPDPENPNETDKVLNSGGELTSVEETSKESYVTNYLKQSLFRGNADGIRDLLPGNVVDYYDDYVHKDGQTIFTGEYNASIPLPISACIGINYDSLTDDVFLNSVAVGISNKLQFQIDDPAIDKEMFDGIGIFISHEISPFRDITNEDFIDRHGDFRLGSLSDSATSHTDKFISACTFTPQYKTYSVIKDELKDIKNLYLVKFLNCEDIATMQDNTWIDVNLRGLLGETLRTLPSISINQLMQSTSLTGNLFTYNGRLHVFDYKAKYGLDTDLFYQDYYTGSGQYDVPTQEQQGVHTSTDKNQCVIVVKNDLGNGTIVENVYADGNQDGEDADKVAIRSTPILSFKGNNIQSITIYMLQSYYKLVDGASKKITRYKIIDIPFVNNRDLGIAYLCDDNLKPFALPKYYASDYATAAESYWNVTDEDEDTPKPSGWRDELFTGSYVENDEYIAKNGIRVSDVYYPYYFDNKSTLQVGHGTVIGMARLSIALSQDTFGRYPLLVFCTDGIYSLGVDTSGSGAYTTVTPFSREVCVNSNSICEIDGAVLFASSKGLMIATQEGVQEFCPQLNGVPRHRPVSEENAYHKDSDGHIIGPSKFWRGLGLLWYAKIIQPSLNPCAHFDEEIDGVNFIDFVADKFTYVQYAAAKNKIIVYSRIRKYYYYIDVATRNATKMKYNIAADDNNYPNTCFYHGFHDIIAPQYNGEDYHEPKGNVTPGRQWFNRLSSEGNVDCLLQTRPIKLDNGLKSSYRVAVRGYFRRNMFATDPNTNIYAVLLVLGSYDGTIWNPIGYRQKDINESYCGFHGLNCDTDHVSYNYMMVIVTAPLTYASHIDGIDITAKSRRDNKLSNI